MVCLACSFAVLGAFAPRAALFILWLFTDLVSSAFGGAWLWPLLGVIFLPLTTLMYVLVVGPLGPTSIWGWLAVGLGFVIDLRGYVDILQNYERIPGRVAAR
jgi:hypothetical protein